MEQHQEAAPGALGSLKLVADYHPLVAEFFHSRSALDWFIRQYRVELVAHDAIAKISGRIYIDADRFPAVARSIAARNVGMWAGRKLPQGPKIGLTEAERISFGMKGGEHA